MRIPGHADGEYVVSIRAADPGDGLSRIAKSEGSHTMGKDQERRRFKRALFTLEDHVIGLFSLARLPDKVLTGYILNLSMGGIYFTLEGSSTILPKVKDKIVLLQIKAPVSLNFLMNVDAETKWVLNTPMLKFIGIGCEFVSLSESGKKQLGNFVDSWQDK
jgi:hypothetical protein